MKNHETHLLIILDGWGYREDAEDNAIARAKTPVWDSLWQDAPRTLISGSGIAVGLPQGQMGNSEVGHMNLGAGRIVDQDFTRINKAIQDGSFADNPVLTRAFSKLANNGSALHLFGLLSPGGVHSHEDHFQASINLAHSMGVKNIRVHAFMDGRDVPPKSALTSLIQLQQHLEALDCGHIASICGRFFSMDRDNRWDRIESAYNLISAGRTALQFDSPEAALQAGYARGETDEFISPSAIVVEGAAASIDNEDQVLFLNFRSDRARQLTRAFVDEEFSGFERTYRPQLADFMTLTRYADDLDTTCVYDSPKLHNSLGEYISNKGLSQLRIAETEKYAHVTFFFSGGQEMAYAREDRLLIASPGVLTYDLQPEMSAPEVTDRLLDCIKADKYDLIICNFANGDMVGHTGIMAAAIRAVECLDDCLGRIIEATRSKNAHCLITADHGNVEQMLDHHSGQAHTAHTSEQVPLIYVGQKPLHLAENGRLCDVAPTLLDIMDLPVPDEMTGRSLVSGSTEKLTG
ncbi:MAG TPA: 2,3-bisphosphoglycerate-independent phosphoglycerate mutase [Pseudomonadales bacterium]|nr:2,3-bisphosphoglycerate-independent phosphoglycerate mutase [Pseudomonadales bacterium]